MQMQVKWLGTPVERKTRPRAQVAGLDLYGHLGAPHGMVGIPKPAECLKSPVFNQHLSNCTAQANSMCNDFFAQDPQGAAQQFGSKPACVETFLWDCMQAAKAYDHCGPCDAALEGKPCTNPEVIKCVQFQLGRTPTGVWSQADDAALESSYNTYVPCTGAAPVPPGPGGGGGGPPVPPPTTSSSGEGTNWGIVLLAAAAAGAIYFGMG